MGDCCLLTFFEYGLSTPVATFNDGQNTSNLEYKYSVNELLFYLANDILMLPEKDAEAHCPILVTIEPSIKRKRLSRLIKPRSRGVHRGRKFRRPTKLKERPALALEV